ncbi:MAG TPA: choice-of-anchor Q domain-containing protein [Haliangiales bacterium]|nr:choice-of-anchor Q domain-containing protein [Haliangiales bacterium]
MRGAAPVLLALLLILGLGACKVANELYCDDTTPCPSGYTCDRNPGPGQNGCVPVAGADAGAADAPIGVADAILCTDAGMCPGAFPICRAGTCGTCAQNTECPVTAPVCKSAGNCDACAGEGDCSGRPTTPHCLTSTGACVVCRNTDADCGGATPVCEATVCRACRKDVECSAVAGICDTDTGRCVTGAEILYVAPGGTGLSCTAASPCGSIKTALTKVSLAQPWIKLLAGSFVESFVVKDMTAHIVGAGASSIIQPDGADPIVWVQGTADLLLRSARIRAGANANADGIRCDGIGATRVRGFDLQIDGNLGTGVNASRCTVGLERSRVMQNAAGGLRLFDTTFAVRNNFIGQNGTADVSAVGGFRLLSAPTGASTFEFNTVSGNRSKADTAPGVQCDAALAMSSDVVWGNGVAPDATAQFAGACTFIDSDIGGPTAAVPPNINANPLFHDAAAGDYHLDPGSPCANAGQPGTATVDDIDGQPRPKPGTLPDIGADEAF